MNIRIISAVFLSIFTVGTYAAQANIIDTCVAVVNEDVITLSEVNEAGKAIFQRVAEQAPPDERARALKDTRNTVIERLIEKRLLLQQAKQMRISISDQEVDKSLAQILSRNNTSMERFRSELAKVGMDEQQYRENLREQMLSSKLINYEVRSKVVISNEVILDYYDQHYTEQVASGGYYILQIGFTTEADGNSENSRKVARQKAERIHSMAAGGSDFKKLANQYSELPSAVDGGDIGTFQADEMAGYMRDAVTALTPGEISPVTESPNGFMFFKLLSSQEGEIITKIPLESVKEEIRNTLYKQEMENRYETWLKEIRSQAYIKIL